VEVIAAMPAIRLACLLALAPWASSPAAEDAAADLIIRGGKVVTADRAFSIHEAMAVKDGRIARVGGDADVLRLRGEKTLVIDLGGKTVLPGLIDSHVHPCGASVTEFDHPVPDMQSIDDVLAYVRSRAEKLGPGPWITVRQVFITRLREQRYPTRDELDRAAPRNPVVFSTGPDASASSLALKLSGIGRGFKVADGGPGFIEVDPATGEPTGILRGATRYLKVEDPPGARTPSVEEGDQRLLELLRDYLATGITAILDRDAGPSEIDRYRRLRAAGRLPLRVAISASVSTIGPLEGVLEGIRKVAADPLRAPDDRLRIIGVKTYLDGGMLTGSAYMSEPWGASKIYGITDPAYRGVLNIPRERLVPMVRAAVESGLQFTAHSVGDGAVDALLDAYEEVDRTLPVRKSRSSITHSNFMSKEAIERAARLGVPVDVQPAWLHLDARTLVAQFGHERMRRFQPLRSIFEAGGIAGGGSDHMQKIGPFRSINPYSPFLGIETAVTRRPRWHEDPLHPEEALTREQAIRFYTANNAYILFRDDEIGSLEPGKLADFIVLDRDILTCPAEEIRSIRVERTYIGGKLAFERDRPR
jgi:predicted amidohydrolase YtcJ